MFRRAICLVNETGDKLTEETLAAAIAIELKRQGQSYVNTLSAGGEIFLNVLDGKTLGVSQTFTITVREQAN